METQETLGLKRDVAEYLAATKFSLAVNRKTSTLHGERIVDKYCMRGTEWFKIEGSKWTLSEPSFAEL